MGLTTSARKHRDTHRECQCDARVTHSVVLARHGDLQVLHKDVRIERRPWTNCTPAGTSGRTKKRTVSASPGNLALGRGAHSQPVRVDRVRESRLVADGVEATGAATETK